MPKKAYIISILACVITTPLFISSEQIILGFPAWAFYSFLMIILYSFIISLLLQIYWSTKKNNNES